MAYFDPNTQTVTVRIIYDGLGTAGKTTNLRMIYELFTLAREGEIVVPEEHKGRTLFFDWLELNTGVVEDYKLRCQVLTVPGQFAYAQRRWQLLRSPDAIVLVCDSTPEGMKRARYAVRFLNTMLRAGNCPDVPIVLQANKQDMPGAISGRTILNELELPDSTTVVDAVASQGDGVRATFIFALQAARERVRDICEQQGVNALPQDVERAESLYSRLLAIDEDNCESDALTDTLMEVVSAEERNEH